MSKEFLWARNDCKNKEFFIIEFDFPKYEFTAPFYLQIQDKKCKTLF